MRTANTVEAMESKFVNSSINRTIMNLFDNPMLNSSTRKKASESHKGGGSWCKGLTKETDERVLKISIAKKGKTLSKEHIKKLKERVFTKEWKKKLKDNHADFSLEKSPSWNGGITMNGGYKYIYTPTHPNHNSTGYVVEHRLIMERHLGRYLEKQEVIHHKNRNLIDNRIDNLMLFKNQKEHSKYHHNLRVENKIKKIIEKYPYLEKLEYKELVYDIKSLISQNRVIKL